VTCIAGAVINGELCIGGDAVSIQGDSNVRISAEGKVFRLGEFLIGSSGTMHMRQVMTYLYEPPAIKGDLTAYMVRHFIPRLRGMMKEHGCEEQTSNGTTEMEGQYLIGVRGRLFSIDGGYGLFQPRLPYAAIGCAAQEALAAMFTAYSLLKDPLAEDIVNRGLLAAAEFDTSVRPPFTVTTIPAEVSRETLVLKNGWYVEQLAKV
jgi:ATP-dependent protease HslVU (ClpYQ) peptidase subunit